MTDVTLSNRDRRFEQLVQTMDPQSTLLHTWALQGGVSAQVTALEIARPDGQTSKLVVRQHGAVDLGQNPHVAANEFELLRLLQSFQLAAPAPYHLDESCAIFATPVIVIEYIEGSQEDAPVNEADCMRQLAAQLSRIHAADWSQADLSFLPDQAQRYAAMVRAAPANERAAGDEERIRHALAAAWPLPERNPATVLHGDFWPGNVLWHNGQLVALIDWEDAAVGDPLADVANARLEILWAFGADALRAFTQQYRSLTPGVDWTDLAYWDLCADLRLAGRIGEWGLDEASEATMRARHRWFVDQAFAALAAR
ncbi:MAG: phosphotransferase [Chloroflexales bacterium]|nr:phosphotransferase [Chloroflexales bacterium]